jgi:uncharacterized DUF497 family protein
MFDRILRRLREKVRAGQYVMSDHAEEQMDEDGLEIFDVEQVVLTGKIIERQRDHQTSEWKYLVRGATLVGREAVVVTKLSFTGKLVIITLYSTT